MEQTVDPATRDFNYDVIRAEDQKPSELLSRLTDLVMTFPMMAERRVVVIRNFDSIPLPARKKIADVLAGTPETTMVILEGEKASLAPKPKSGCAAESFKPIYENNLPAWIRQRFRKLGFRVDDEVIGLLINNIGAELGELNSEIEKTALIAGGSDRVTIENARSVVGAFRRETMYGFCNAVGCGDMPESLRILTVILNTEKNRETYILSVLASHLLKIATFHAQLGEGVPRQEAMKTVSPSPFLWKLNNMDKQVGYMNEHTIRRAMNAIARTESLLKKSAGYKRLLLELMLPFVMPAGAGKRSA